MLAYLRRPHIDLAALVLRIGLAAIFIMQGYMKLSQAESWTDQLSPEMQKFISWAEFVCGLALAAGLLTRLAALVVLIDMIGAIMLVTGSRGFPAITFSPKSYDFNAGAAYNVMIIAACLALMLLGSGIASLDHLLFGRRRAGPAAGSATSAPHLAASAGPANRLGR